MQTTTKALLIVGGVAAAGAAAASWLRRRALPTTTPFYGLPSQPWHDKERWTKLGRVRQDEATQRWYDEAGYGVMTDVADLVNAYGGEKDAGKALGRGLARQHRTLQSNFFRALPHMLRVYSETAGTDLRNEAAVKLARKLEECTKDEFLSFV